ncbi:hypothetical protein FRC06_008429 [Ceratobasidium sp. 370]|nr:hypothetical protein FRC06_008429 [Ceratobasidium sp. 370]
MGATPVTTLSEFHNIASGLRNHELVWSSDVVPQINSGKPIVIEFWATWCGPCRNISPTFEKLSEHAEGVDFYKIDVDSAPDVALELGIRKTPTFVVFKDGKKVTSVVGVDHQRLEELVRQAQGLK